MVLNQKMAVTPAPIPILPGIASGGPPLQLQEEGQLDVRKYFRVLRKRVWYILLVALIFLGSIAFYTLRLPKIYKATATVQIEIKPPRVLGKEVEEVSEMGTGGYWNNREYLATQYAVITSRDIATRVVRSLDLHKDQDFLYGVERLRNPSYNGRTLAPLEAAIRLQRMVLVEPIKDSRMVRIAIEHPIPEKAQLIANTYADEYMEHNLEVVLESTINAVGWLSKQLQTLQDELDTSERNLYDFKVRENILSVSLSDRQNYLANEIEKISEGLAEIKMKRIELAAKKDQVAKIPVDDPLAMPITPLLDNNLMQELKSQYSVLSQEKMKMAEQYGENWPAMKELDAKLEEIRRNIKREVDNILKSIKLQYQETVQAEAGFRSQIEALQKQAHEMNLKEIEYNKLFRQKENTEKLYSLVLSRTKEADLQKILKANNIRLLDRAIKPVSPVRPKVKLNLLIGLIVGLLAGIGLAFLLEYMDISIKTQEEVEQELGLTFLGIVPAFGRRSSNKGRSYYYYGFRRGRRKRKEEEAAEGVQDGKPVNKDLFVLHNPKSAAAECIRSIRTNILFKSAENPARMILITSPNPQEGKTTVGISLAVTMAQSGNRTILVDTDMRRPRVHKAFGMSSEKGISSVILGIDSLEQAIVPAPVENLHVLPCGPIPPNPAEILHTQRFAELVDQLMERYDRLIFDSPPIIAVTDAAILATRCDGVVFVVRPLHTLKNSIRQSIRMLTDVGGRVFGVVFNNLDLENKDYGYYHYYYSRRYGYYQKSDKADGKGGGEPSSGGERDYTSAIEP